jgi:hypothetical protein
MNRPGAWFSGHDRVPSGVPRSQSRIEAMVDVASYRRWSLSLRMPPPGATCTGLWWRRHHANDLPELADRSVQASSSRHRHARGRSTARRQWSPWPGRPPRYSCGTGQRTPTRAQPELSLDLLAEPDGLLEPVGHVALVAVDRLDRQPDALPGGVLGNASSASSRTPGPRRGCGGRRRTAAASWRVNFSAHVVG